MHFLNWMAKHMRPSNSKQIVLRGSLVMLWARTQKERFQGCSVCFRSATLNLLERILNKFGSVKELQRKESTSQIMPVQSKLTDLIFDCVFNPKLLSWDPSCSMPLIYSPVQPVRSFAMQYQDVINFQFQCFLNDNPWFICPCSFMWVFGFNYDLSLMWLCH